MSGHVRRDGPTTLVFTVAGVEYPVHYDCEDTVAEQIQLMEAADGALTVRPGPSGELYILAPVSTGGVEIEGVQMKLLAMLMPESEANA